MGGSIEQLEFQDVVLSVECNEPEGPVVRHVRRLYLSFAQLRGLWEKLGKFEVLFTAQHNHDFGTFVQYFVKEVEPGRFEATGLFWAVDDVGILYISNIAPGFEASAHFSFWDRRFRGRERLVLEMMKYVFDLLSLHRISVEVPVYVPALMAFVERLGFVREGRKRRAAFYKDKWFDTVTYSILSDEV